MGQTFRKIKHSIKYEYVPTKEVISDYGEDRITMIELGSLKANNTYLFILTIEPLVNQFLAYNVVD